MSAIRHTSSVTITLVRHGVPDCPTPSWVSASEFASWLDAYQRAPLTSSEPPGQGRRCRADQGVIICSALRRAKMSAEVLYPGAPIQTSALYNEADVPAVRVPLLKLPVGVWVVIARICWMIGYHAGIESVAAARHRARRAADALSHLAFTQGVSVLVGHGWMNRLIGKQLRKDGWTCVGNTGNGFFAFAQYEWQGVLEIRNGASG